MMWSDEAVEAAAAEWFSSKTEAGKQGHGSWVELPDNEKVWWMADMLLFLNLATEVQFKDAPAEVVINHDAAAAWMEEHNVEEMERNAYIEGFVKAALTPAED